MLKIHRLCRLNPYLAQGSKLRAEIQKRTADHNPHITQIIADYNSNISQINTGKREKSVKICADLCPIKRSADFADFTD
jgi:hypothetical protein